MSRTIINLECKDPKKSEETIKNILNKYKYELKEKNGEEFYKNGVGVLVAPKFIKYTIDGNKITLEGWVRNFVIMGESSLDGFVGGYPKKSCKKVLQEIETSIE